MTTESRYKFVEIPLERGERIKMFFQGFWFFIREAGYCLREAFRMPPDTRVEVKKLESSDPDWDNYDCFGILDVVELEAPKKPAVKRPRKRKSKK